MITLKWKFDFINVAAFYYSTGQERQREKEKLGGYRKATFQFLAFLPFSGYT